jgi:AcrR family transcriptional regulator
MQSRRERRKEQTRAALLHAAITLFAERGIYGTRVEDITERVDLGKGAFYNYFPSKDALIAVLVAEGVRTFEEEYLSRLNGTDVVAARVVDLARLHADFLDQHPQYGLLFHQARGLLLLKETQVERLREVFADYLRSVGHALIPNGRHAWSDEDLLELAAAFVGEVSGYRSFRIAAALAPKESIAAEVLALGIPGLIEHWESSRPR